MKRLIDILKYEDKNVSASKKTIALSVASLANTVLNTILQMLIARMMSKREIAVYSQTLLVYSTVFPILQLGVPSGIYYCFVRNPKKTKSITNTAITIMFALAATFVVLMFAGGNSIVSQFFSNELLKKTLCIMLPALLFTLPESVILTVLVYKNRIRFNSIYTVIKSLLTVTIILISLFLGNTAEHLIIVRAGIAVCEAVFSVFIIYKYVLIHESSAMFEKDLCRELMAVSVPLGMATMAGVLSTNLDSWIVSSRVTAEAYTIFKMGAYEIPFISTITGSIMTVITVSLNEKVVEKKYEEALELFRSVAKKTSLFLMPIMMFFLFAAKNFICFMYTEEYVEAVSIFQLYLLYIPIRIVTYGPLMIALGKSKALLAREVMSLLINALLSWNLVSCFGACGATLSTLIATYFFSVPANLHIISKECKTRWYKVLPFRHIFLCVVLSLPSGLGAWIVDIFIFRNIFGYFGRLVGMAVVFGIIQVIFYKVFLKIDFVDIFKSYVKRRLTNG